LVFPVVSFLLAFPLISYMHSSSLPFVLHALPIMFRPSYGTIFRQPHYIRLTLFKWPYVDP
jgi:hypothetical protein